MNEILSFIKYLATSNAINFIIMLVLLGWILNKLQLGNSFESSIKFIKDSISNSENERKQANKNLQNSKKILSKLPDDIKQMEQNTKEKIEIFKAQIEENTQKTIFEMESNADKIIELEEAKVANILTDKTSLVSINMAKKRIVDLLNTNPQMHNQFIQQSIDELERVDLG
ncbi:MAG: ATP synthase F0 subunit B [Cyanobacteria bacterium SIG26]|nr:ATP synthase F0 subunit B [Cyanobacteria bacterium SIG26]